MPDLILGAAMMMAAVRLWLSVCGVRSKWRVLPTIFFGIGVLVWMVLSL